MENVIICGVEEPIRANHMLRQIDEDAVGVHRKLAEFTDPRLDRYSFVQFGSDRNQETAFESLFRAILTNHAIQMWRVRTWLLNPKGTEYQRISRDGTPQRVTLSQAPLNRLAEEGWTTHSDEGVLVAALRVDHPLDALTLKELHVRNGAPILTLLGIPPLEAWAALFRRCIRGALPVVMPPSEGMLRLLADFGCTTLYMERSNGDHMGVIVVGTLKIDVEALIRAGIIAAADDAQRVWLQSPRYMPIFNTSQDTREKP